MATSASHEATNILTRLIGQQIRLRRRGYKIGRATDGFKNVRIVVDGKKCVIEVPDEERAKYYVTMLELRAAGQLSDEQICARINAMGYRSMYRNRWDRDRTRIVGRIGGKPLTPKRLQFIIRRTILCGVICEKWTQHRPVRAAYPGLVSIETFNAANRGKVVITDCGSSLEIAYDQTSPWSTKRSKENPIYPFRKVVRCSDCRKPFLGSAPRGKAGNRFPTYHCSRAHRYLGIPKKTFEDAVEAYVGGLRFRPESRAALVHWLRAAFENRREEVVRVSREVIRRSADIEQRKATLAEAFALASSDAMRRSLEIQLAALEEEQRASQAVRQELPVGVSDIDAFLRDAEAIMEHPGFLLEKHANPLQLETLYGLTFDEPPTYAEIANGTPNLAWVFRLSSEPKGALSRSVRDQRLNWNLIEQTVLRWKAAAPVIAPLLRKTLRKVPDVPMSLQEAA